MRFGAHGATRQVFALTAVVVSAAVALLDPSDARAQGAPAIEWDGGRLSVEAEQVPLRDVLEGVAHRTGIAFSGTGRLRDDVSFHFSGLSFGEALKRLAVGFNHVVVEERTPSGGIRPVLVLFLSEIDLTDERRDELGVTAKLKTEPPQIEGERVEVESASRRIAARVLLDQADAEALPPGPSKRHLLLQLERGLARQVELDRQLEAAAGRAVGAAAAGKATEE
jgi:hypothetical protein